MNTVRIAVIDSQPLYRLGVVRSLLDDPDVVVVGEGDHAIDAISIARDTRVDVILMDIDSPDETVRAARVINSAWPDVKFILICDTELDARGEAVRAMRAHGFLERGSSECEVRDAIWAVQQADSATDGSEALGHVDPRLAALGDDDMPSATRLH